MPERPVTLLVGTKRGLFIVRSDDERDRWHVSTPRLNGREVYHAFIDPRDGTAWAATDHAVWGAHVHRSDDGGQTWETLATAPHYDDERGLAAIWHLAPGPADAPDAIYAGPGAIYAGIEPAGLFVSGDRGETWQPVAALNDHPT
ncbi:MAG TPA: sialidase family protein, partial [Longimicrobiales bacterium]|nr:sialidase family protein [Longimicrobiales bacterium]